MKIFFGGAEKGMYASMLTAQGISRLGVNLTHFSIPKKKVLDLKDKFNNSELLVYTSEADEDVTRYDAFLRANADDITYVIGRPDYNGDWLGSKYIPIWNDPTDLERFNYLCQRYGRVAISDKALSAHPPTRINSIAKRWTANLIGITSKPEQIENIEWEAVVVGSWSSAVRYGETQVWTGHGLRRYPAQQKDSARKRHRADIERLGISYEAVINDEVDAVAELAIKSWKLYEQRVFGGYDHMETGSDDDNEVIKTGDITIMSPQSSSSDSASFRGGSIVIPPPEKRHESERVLLPVVGIENVTSIGSQTVDNEGESIEIAPEQVSVLRYKSNPLRQCDNCYLASKCPSFKEHTECAYNLPIEIRTKDQLQSALRAMLEMQVSRVLFARFAEELKGQGMDPALSEEMDRVFDMVEKFKSITDTRDLVRFEVEARGSSGVLSRLFGQRAAEVANPMPYGGLGPAATDAMYGEIMEVEEE